MDRWTPTKGVVFDAAKDEVSKLGLKCTSGDCSRKRTKLNYTKEERPVVGDGRVKGTIGSVMKGRRKGESGVQKCCIRTKGKTDGCDCFTDDEGDCSACYANADCTAGVKLALGRGKQDCAKKFDLRSTCSKSATVAKAKIITDAGAKDGVVADLSSAIEKIEDQVTAVRNLKPYNAKEFVGRVKEAKKEIEEAKRDTGNAKSLVEVLSLKCGDEGVDCQRCCKRTSDGCACISEASGACRPKCSDYLGAAAADALETLPSGRRDRRAMTATSAKLLPAGPVKGFLNELATELSEVQTKIPKINDALKDPDVQSLCKDCLGAAGVKPIREVLTKVRAVEAQAKAEIDGQKKGYSEYVKSVESASESEYKPAQKAEIGAVKQSTEALFSNLQTKITDIGKLEEDFSTEASTAFPPEESTSAASSTTSAFGVVSFAIIVAVAIF